MPPPSCAGKLAVAGLGKCPRSVTRFRISCLQCRLRRYRAGKYTVPRYIEYTYTSFRYVTPGKRVGGRRVLIYHYPYVLIDPRGHFTMIRCAAIIVMDKLIALSRRVNRHPRHMCRPWIEIAEFLANYPVW